MILEENKNEKDCIKYYEKQGIENRPAKKLLIINKDCILINKFYKKLK